MIKFIYMYFLVIAYAGIAVLEKYITGKEDLFFWFSIACSCFFLFCATRAYIEEQVEAENKNRNKPKDDDIDIDM